MPYRRAPRLALALATCGLAAAVGSFAAAQPATRATPTENLTALLKRQTQELLDAVTNGRADVWESHLDGDATYTAEDGSVSSKKDMVAQVRPLPDGVSGKLVVTDFVAHPHGSVAVTTYVSDENERYHGHDLHCQYRETDTWKKTSSGWKLIAAQVLALRADPPAIALPPSRLADYAGRYSLAPDEFYEIRLRDNGLEGQQTGRKVEELRAEAPDVLFIVGKPRYRLVFRRDGDGHVTGFAERREAWDLDWTREP